MIFLLYHNYRLLSIVLAIIDAALYNLVENEYVLLGVEILTEPELSADLDKYAESAQSNSFGFGEYF